ncbi:hypothetical protein C4K23_2647 [Pseudomonas chlororaphis]|nr:hypothetical protein C4K23_2647 [Pseudomonas chlororaphis]
MVLRADGQRRGHRGQSNVDRLLLQGQLQPVGASLLAKAATRRQARRHHAAGPNQVEQPP